MSLFVITGNPRSGKSYYSVWYIATKYFNRMKDGSFVLKKEFADLKIISNIDKLKLPHDSLDTILKFKEYPTPAHFFSYDSQVKISEKYPKLIYLIDEAQFFFPYNFKDIKVFNWIQLHGHFGQDIYFITQSITLLPRQITDLAEYEINALSKSSGIFFGKDLWYNTLSKGIIIDKSFKLKKQWVFDLYKSENSSSVEKVRNPFLKYFALILISLVFGLWQARSLIFREKKPEQKNISSIVPQSSQKNSSSPVVTQNVPVNLSYIVEDGVVFVLFDGIFYKQKDFPYQIKNGPFKTLIAYVPPDLVKTESVDSGKPSKSEKAIF